MRRVAAEQLLLASSTTEGQNGGNIRSSAAAVERAGAEISLLRDATVISYGAEADGIVTIARRANEAAAIRPGDAGNHQGRLYAGAARCAWETLGMRGTCSAGFKLKVEGTAEQIFPEAYDKIHAQTMTPVAHLCWSSVWAGIAAAAVDRAQAIHPQGRPRLRRPTCLRARAHFTAAKMTLTKLRAIITANLDSYAAREQDERALSSLDFQSSINLLKVEASELAVATVHARDARLRPVRLPQRRRRSALAATCATCFQSPIMINNDRILANMRVAPRLMSGVPRSLRD